MPLDIFLDGELQEVPHEPLPDGRVTELEFAVWTGRLEHLGLPLAADL